MKHNAYPFHIYVLYDGPLQHLFNLNIKTWKRLGGCLGEKYPSQKVPYWKKNCRKMGRNLVFHSLSQLVFEIEKNIQVL